MRPILSALLALACVGCKSTNPSPTVDTLIIVNPKGDVGARMNAAYAVYDAQGLPLDVVIVQGDAK